MISILRFLLTQSPTFSEQIRTTIEQNKGAKDRTIRYRSRSVGVKSAALSPLDIGWGGLIRCADPNYLVEIYFFLNG